MIKDNAGIEPVLNGAMLPITPLSHIASDHHQLYVSFNHLGLVDKNVPQSPTKKR